MVILPPLVVTPIVVPDTLGPGPGQGPGVSPRPTDPFTPADGGGNPVRPILPDPPTPPEPRLPASVPEPQTWALMILGFGLLGALVRRRRPLRT